jgi:UDP-N-acetylmuramyl pentapeptide phosphotransferase/UDP-N-acetylglucosamine-1-phosphate transferase
MIPSPRAELRRTNFAGREVSLAEGALVVGGVTALAAGVGRRADVAALAGIGALGLLDDLLEPRLRRAGRPVSKGLRGHLGALRDGHLTTGAAKALGIPLLALAGAAAAPAPRRAAMVLADAALAAGCANLANLLDLRPGRALKAVLPGAVLLALAPGDTARGSSGRRLALAAALPGLLALPADLRERGMLGDAGANVLGAAVGAAASRRLPVPARLALLGVVVALTLASERVSFSAVIDRSAGLRALDRLGRLPDPTPPTAADRDPGRQG